MHSATASLPTVAIDLAKNVFQLYFIGTDGKPVNRRITRAKLLTFFANRERSLVAMETCAGAHHWARQLLALGHEVKLLPAQHVKAFVQGDKTDAKDAQAIYVASGQPHIHPVPVKSVQQQSLLMHHKQREGLLKERIAQCAPTFVPAAGASVTHCPPRGRTRLWAAMRRDEQPSACLSAGIWHRAARRRSQTAARTTRSTRAGRRQRHPFRSRHPVHAALYASH